MNTRATLILTYYIVLLIAAVALSMSIEWFNAGIAITVILVITPLAILMATRQSGGGAVDSGSELAREVRHMANSIETLTQESGLSEAAKRVLHRRQERDLLCKAIEQDITDKDWNAAMVLVKELAERFGYRADAEQFRGRIERARAETLSQEVESAISRLKEILEDQRWTDAFAEAASIQRLFPESPRVDGLQQLVAGAKERRKMDLEREFLEAAQREETDRAMELLKSLDGYLTEDEAEHFREVARGVIGRAKENLGVRFKLLVQDKNWNKALEVAEEILDEFPNSRMADEIRGMIDTLRNNAAQMRQIQSTG
ncbi:MAG: hypothetical protein ACYTF7_03300 [Planctomycetota bacterium]|jgi:hypothetical protein